MDGYKKSCIEVSNHEIMHDWYWLCGLVSGVCFSDMGNIVYCVDKDQKNRTIK